MKLKDITLKNISEFIEGNFKYLMDTFKTLPKHEKEQVLWRASKCPPSCSRTGMCHYCSCDYPAKLYVHKSCNKGLTLPDIMDEESWKQYKKKQIENDKTNFELP